MTDSEDKKGRILIVDDTQQNVQVLGTMLRQRDYRINVAQNGLQALETVKKIAPDLILLDIMMPEMDGFETCKRLKESEETKDIPVIFLTAKTEPDDIIKGFQLGAVDYVTKPFSSAELLARVQTHLEMKFNRETIVRQYNEQNELLHILCHDLANPFCNLKGILELVTETPSLLDQMLEPMDVSIEAGLNIIDLVREMRALEEERMALYLTGHDLGELLHESLSILRQRIQDKNLQVDVKVVGSHTVLVERISFINSVLNNILTNAIKFSFPGSRIEVDAVREDDSIIVSIRDFGIGMSSGLLNDVFKPNRVTSRKGTEGETGTGFGMPLVKKFVLAYGGSIDVFSKEKTEKVEDHGTEIKLRLKTA
ncbi:MAG: hybrid sensor histidine kinase/response regulator [Proteobacteria bacterium]|nr:hybrid sensor histidine kinase/response regulator [Pseudomonadota bacterium]